MNKLSYTGDFNPLVFHSFYNGGGVAIGDINNDGLQDIFFCGNQQPNRLYLNLGNFRFQDISESAGITTLDIWSSGVTFTDVNGDGYLDIFVSVSADFAVGWRNNQLFINNKNLTFSEESGKYNLGGYGYSTHAAFFDYDRDGDLDCYFLGNSGNSNSSFYGIREQRNIVSSRGGNKLLRNDNGKFVNVTEEAKIYGSSIGYGLGVTISDLNKDGWPDIYVSNDFFEKDYLYINQKDGTFKESLEKYIREISYFSMGADAADINNDAYPDIFVTDMLPELEGRIKAKTSFENYEKYQANIRNGYYQQFLRNTLQLNLGPGFQDEKGNPECYFSEISRYAGIHASDWSWSSLVTDMDNDGFKDIFISNGMAKDVTDQDFIQFIASDSLQQSKNRTQSYQKIMDLLPSQPLANYAYQNNGDLTFTNQASEWGLDIPIFSNGSAYADLDNDGDMDLVTNNINSPASVYQNNATELKQNSFLKVVLQGDSMNHLALGSKITLYAGGKIFYQEVNPTRGFMSGVDVRPNFGLGKIKVIDSLRIDWPDGRVSIDKNITVNQTKKYSKSSSRLVSAKEEHFIPLLKKVSVKEAPFEFIHQNQYSDFYNNRLLFYMPSATDPHVAVADVNSDGREDVLFSGNETQAPSLFIQQPSGKFVPKELMPSKDKLRQEKILFFDADDDGDQDLYVCYSGGQLMTDSLSLQDKIYFNDGRGNFSWHKQSLPVFLEHSSCVAASDFDADGDLDLFVGTRMQKNKYGYPASGYLLENDGKGVFADVTKKLAPELFHIGMITDAAWFDYEKDGKPELIVCGEYMPLTVLKNENSKWVNRTEALGLAGTSGWWNTLLVKDIDGDGFDEIIAGNHGLNSRFKASKEQPISLYVNDFDRNGNTEAIVCTYNGGTQFPMALRHDLVSSLPSLKKKFLNYEQYKEKTIDQIFSPEQISSCYKTNAYELRSGILMNHRGQKLEFVPLPREVQFSSVFALAADDFDKDGKLDLITGGNFYQAKPDVGINDGSYGCFLKGDGKGAFNFIAAPSSGVFIKGAVRDIKPLNVNGQKLLLFSKNNDSVEFIKY